MKKRTVKVISKSIIASMMVSSWFINAAIPAVAVTTGKELVENLNEDEDYFIIPESGNRYLERPDMIELEDFELQMALYEIYARRGMMFSIPEVQEYFEGKNWYKGMVSEDEFSDELLNAYEIQNIEILERAVSVVTDTEMSGEITGELGHDVQNGLLYSNEDGQITDKDGNIIDAYSNICVLPNGALTDDVIIYESYFAGAGGKIVQDIPEAVDYGNDYNLAGTPQYFEENITATVTTNDHGNGIVLTEVDDDGNYFDEVVSGAWFDSVGIPIASFPPDGLWVGSGDIWSLYDKHSGTVQYQHFDDAMDIDSIKRTGINKKNTYSMLLKNIQKQTNEWGQMYIVGIEYYSNMPVVLNGNFGSGLLNGDNVLAFGKYTGLASDDTPNFDAIYIEIENGRF